jgi:hypothetical protein
MLHHAMNTIRIKHKSVDSARMLILGHVRKIHAAIKRYIFAAAQISVIHIRRIELSIKLYGDVVHDPRKASEKASAERLSEEYYSECCMSLSDIQDELRKLRPHVIALSAKLSEVKGNLDLFDQLTSLPEWGPEWGPGEDQDGDPTLWHSNLELAFDSLRAFVEKLLEGKTRRPPKQIQRGQHLAEGIAVVPTQAAGTPAGLNSPSLPEAKRSADGQAKVRFAVTIKPEKGNIELLRDKDRVSVRTAASFGGVKPRAIQAAISKGRLDAVGERQNRRISVESLLKYFPPENSAH